MIEEVEYWIEFVWKSISREVAQKLKTKNLIGNSPT